jgi:tetratricopeptide (TPR) repeat protein
VVASAVGDGSYAQPPSRPLVQAVHQAQAKPGAFAPKAEKRLFKALQQAKNQAPAELWATTMREVADSEPDYRVAAWSLMAMFLAEHDPDTTLSCLDSLLRQRVDPLGSEFIRKYAPNMGVNVEVAPGITQMVLFGWDWVAVSAAVLFEQRGEVEQALAAADVLSDSIWTRLLRSNLCLKLDQLDRILALTDGITNQDDESGLLVVLRGIALGNEGENSAALLAFKEALRFPSRSVQVRHRARVQRALTYLELGQPAKARQDLDRVLAEDSQFPGLQDALAALVRGSQSQA